VTIGWLDRQIGDCVDAKKERRDGNTKREIKELAKLIKQEAEKNKRTRKK
jgi:hypothetical protein